MIEYQAKVYRDGRRFSVEFPDLPGCFSDGKTREEALENAREALSLHLEEARDPQWQIPPAIKRKGKDYHWVQPHEDVAIPLLIRQARLKHGLTQKQLSSLMGITIQQLQKLETPGKSNPTIKTLATITQALNEKLKIKIAA